ncbi:MAG TPA: hypothetical protein VEL76_16090 [Gemmataceae bacterium]|nr:hypothetical protein [Gemmataceae bacterium]
MVGGLAILIAAVFVGVDSVDAGGKKDKAKYTISDVMLTIHKSGLMAKVAKGEGNKADAEKVVEYYVELAKNKPPAGDPDLWGKRTKELVEAAKAVVKGDEGAGKRLQKAANCGTCHKAFKG